MIGNLKAFLRRMVEGKKNNRLGEHETKQTFPDIPLYRVMSARFERVERRENCVRVVRRVVLFRAISYPWPVHRPTLLPYFTLWCSYRVRTFDFIPSSFVSKTGFFDLHLNVALKNYTMLLYKMSPLYRILLHLWCMRTNAGKQEMPRLLARDCSEVSWDFCIEILIHAIGSFCVVIIF